MLLREGFAEYDNQDVEDVADYDDVYSEGISALKFHSTGGGRGERFAFANSGEPSCHHI